MNPETKRCECDACGRAISPRYPTMTLDGFRRKLALCADCAVTLISEESTRREKRAVRANLRKRGWS